MGNLGLMSGLVNGKELSWYPLRSSQKDNEVGSERNNQQVGRPALYLGTSAFKTVELGHHDLLNFLMKE